MWTSACIMLAGRMDQEASEQPDARLRASQSVLACARAFTAFAYCAVFFFHDLGCTLWRMSLPA